MKLLNRLTSQIQARGIPEGAARNIATKGLEKQGSLKGGELTARGKQRQALGAAGRAKERASRISGGKHKPSEYDYDPRTNLSKLITRTGK